MAAQDPNKKFMKSYYICGKQKPSHHHWELAPNSKGWAGAVSFPRRVCKNVFLILNIPATTKIADTRTPARVWAVKFASRLKSITQVLICATFLVTCLLNWLFLSILTI